MIPYGRQTINEDDIQAVVDVLRSDLITQGPLVPAFEQGLCAATSAHYAVAVNSATSALHIACRALSLGPGDWLWTTPISFVASANCALYCGAQVDFVDIDPSTYSLCPKALRTKLEAARRDNCLPKIVVPVHMCGHSCDMQAIYQLAQEYDFRIIEDASHAIGGYYQDSPVGCCQYSDITVFSFHPVKIITTGEGGAALTNNPELAKNLQLLRNHGITRDPNLLTQSPDGPWCYEQQQLGHNYRLTDLQAALGLSQLQRLTAVIHTRQQLADSYHKLLGSLPVVLPQQKMGVVSAYHLYVIRLPNADRLAIYKKLTAAGIGVNVHYIPIYKQPYYQALGFSNYYCPEAENYYREALTLPLFPGLAAEQQAFIASQLKEALVVDGV